MKYFLIIFIILTFYSCNEASKTKEAKKEIKKVEIKKKDLRTLTTEKDFKGIEHSYQNLLITIPETFKMKNSKLFFEENGTNLSIEKDYLNTSLHDYVIKNYKILKKDFSNTIKEEEELYINKNIVRYAKFIIDRKKFFIQIESILIKDNNDLYIITISGKKKHIDLLSKTSNNIFSTIKLNN